MKEDLLGSMRDGVLAQRDALKGALVKQLKMQVPKGGIPAWRKIQAMDNLGIMDFMKLRNEYGDKAIDELFGDIYALKADGRRKQSGV